MQGHVRKPGHAELPTTILETLECLWILAAVPQLLAYEVLAFLFPFLIGAGIFLVERKTSGRQSDCRMTAVCPHTAMWR